MRDPLLLPAVLVIAGILAGRTLEFTPAEAAWPMAALALLSLAARRFNRRLFALAGMLAILLGGAFLEAARRPGRAPVIDAGPREVLILEGCVVEPMAFSADRARFTLELAPGARARVSLPLEEDAGVPRLAYGQRVEVDARLRRPRNYKNPGAFDYAGYLARRGIFWTAFMPAGASAKVLPGRCGSRVMAWIFALRAGLIDRIERLYAGDDWAATMMLAVLVGENTRLERAWTEDFRRTGSYHALVISGVHVTVLAGVLLFLLRLARMPQLGALGVTAAAAWVYALMAGFSPPVVRAAGGFSLYLGARLVFRRARILNLLAAVALAYLAWDPEELFDPSFQLSFLAVAALGALAAPWIDATTGPLRQGMRGIVLREMDPHLEPRVAQWRVETRLAAETLALWVRLPAGWVERTLAGVMRASLFSFELLVVSLVVQVGLALPMIAYFHRLAITSLSSNLFIVPAMNLLVPAGFLASITEWPWAGEAARLLLAFSAKAAHWHARLEPGLRLADPPLWLATAFAAALLATALATRPRARWLAAGAAAALLAGLIWQPWPPTVEPRTLELTAIDVGQGESLLVVFPAGATMLVDGGGVLTYGRPRRLNFDTGEDVVSPYLLSRGIRTLDVVAATHAHQDHIGGLPALIGNFRPKELWTGASPPPDLLDHARRAGVRVVEQRARPAFDYSGARVEILAPTPDYSAARPGNNDSLAFRIAYGGRSFLLTGDLERAVEADLLVRGRVVHADVLKVGHHGSRTSTTGAFLDAVAPSLALISAGYENSFGHPHPEVLDRLRARHTAILRTDLHGLATVRTDGRRVWFELADWRPRRILDRPPILEGLLQ